MSDNGNANNDNLVPLGEFKWTDDYSYHRHMTCLNHTHLRWTTKNPWFRSVFYAGPVDGNKKLQPAGDMREPECKCPWSDLRVVVDESQSPHELCCPWGTQPERTPCEPHELCDAHWKEYWGDEEHSNHPDSSYVYWLRKRNSN